MNLCFDQSLGLGYKSNSQKIRVMSESWVNDNIFCPVCGNARISKLENNRPVADFQCPSCGEIFELKSKDGRIGRKISDGAYDTMISRITSMTNPDLLVMHYSSLQVVDLTVVPKFFFTPTVIEKRKPLLPTCWVSVKQFSKNDTATACQDWLRSTRLGRGSIKSHVRTVKVLGMGLFAFQERVHLWKGVTH